MAVRIENRGILVQLGAILKLYKVFIMNDYATQCDLVQFVKIPLLTEGL